MAKKIKKIYKYINRMVKRCEWCKGTGVNLYAFVGERCDICDGAGGEWRRIRELVGEEVIDE
jgi:hypothetical protein